MDNKSIILGRIRKNKPSEKLPIDHAQFLKDHSEKDMLADFCAHLEDNDGSWLMPDKSASLTDLLTKEVENKSFVDLCSLVKAEKGMDVSKVNHPRELAHVKVLIVRGKLGVAENAAIWVEDEMIQNVRVLPFIVERTIIILQKSDIVASMHQAYQKLANVNTGFGTFIAGPSKTGDIEQNLVIGAHGALSHLVVLVD